MNYKTFSGTWKLAVNNKLHDFSWPKHICNIIPKIVHLLDLERKNSISHVKQYFMIIINNTFIFHT